MTSSAIATIGENVSKNEKLLVLPQSEFNRVKTQIKSGKVFKGYEVVNFGGKKHKVPVYQLLGKWAEDLDDLVADGLYEYKQGKSIPARSLKEAVLQYGKRRSKNFVWR